MKIIRDIKERTQKHDLSYLVFALIIFAVYMLVTRFEFIYGSRLDWDSQYVQIADYLRQSFYDTKSFFPDYAFNLGGGQNIYYYSFYGLLSPLMLLSYLMPFITMRFYITAVSLLGVFVSVSLFYVFMKGKVTGRVAFFSALVFLFAAPIIFNSHRQLVFTNYMPFMILAMISLDSYFRNGKRIPLIISLFLLIMTNYFFSVSCIAFLLVYGNYLFIEKEWNFIHWIKMNVKLCLTMLISVLMSAVLLIPTALCILSGRSSGSSDTNVFDLIFPHINSDAVLYNHYSMGLTCLFLAAVSFALLSKKTERNFLGWVFLLCAALSVIPFMLNGGMYPTGKTLIPLIPMAVMMIGFMIEATIEQRYSIRGLGIFYVILGIMTFFTLPDDRDLLFITDYISVLVLLVMVYFKIWKKYLLYALLIVPLSVMVSVNRDDGLVTGEDDALISQNNTDISYLVDNALSSEENVYRFSNQVNSETNINQVYNMDYLCSSSYSSLGNSCMKDFFYNKSLSENPYRNQAIYGSSENILFNFCMGEKYMLTESAPPRGYILTEEKGDISIYENDDVLPLGYSSEDSDIIGNITSQIKLFDLRFPQEIIPEDGVVNLEEKTKFSVDIPENLQDKILIVTMDVNNSGYDRTPVNRWGVKLPEDGRRWGDVDIKINGMKNKLSNPNWKYFNENNHFTYVISRNKDIEKLNVTMKEGSYSVSNICGYYLDYDVLKEIRAGVDDFVIDKEETKGNTVVGTINARGNGVFSMSVPYDKGYSLKIDGKSADFYENEQGMMSAEISGGSHEICVSFAAPGKIAGVAVSVGGLILFALVLCMEKGTFKGKKNGKKGNKRAKGRKSAEGIPDSAVLQ